MLIAEKPALRAVGLAEHDVSDRLKARVFPCREESIDFRPAIEHNGRAIHLEYPVRFMHRGLEPVGVDVVPDASTAPVSVIHQIRWIGENEIDAVCRHLAHDLDAIALHDAIDEPILNCGLCLHDLDLLCGPGVISQDTHRQGARDGRSQGGRRLFRGRPSGGAGTRRASAGRHARLLGNGTARQTKQNPARRRARPASLSRCLREHAGQEEICLPAWAVPVRCSRFAGQPSGALGC